MRGAAGRQHPAHARVEVVPQDARPHGGVRGRRHWQDLGQEGQTVRSHRQCLDKTPAGASYLPEPIRLVERDSVIDLTELPSVEMVASAAEDLGEI